jgi:hypothetical protein
MSCVSQYRLKEEIAAYSAEGLPDVIPTGVIVEYTPSIHSYQQGKLVEVRWQSRCYRVAITDMLNRADFIGTK